MLGGRHHPECKIIFKCIKPSGYTILNLKNPQSRAPDLQSTQQRVNTVFRALQWLTRSGLDLQRVFFPDLLAQGDKNALMLDTAIAQDSGSSQKEVSIT